MDVLINELSLHGQFESQEKFIDSSLIDFIKLFSFFVETEHCPLKNFTFYESKVTSTTSFHALITDRSISRTSDVIKKYKTLIDKLILEPFWETNKIHSSEIIYSWNEELVTNSSIAESYERNAILVSFKFSIFEINELIIHKDFSENRKINNIYDLNKSLEYLYDNNYINFHHFCKYFYKNSKLSFEFVNKEKSFDLIVDKNDEIEFLNSFNLFSGLSWSDIIAQGGKGDSKVGLAYSKYHKPKLFKSYNTKHDITKFRCSQKYRTFGYREGDTFYVLEFDLTHRLSD